MTQMFAYIPFKNGAAEDVALEYRMRQKIDPSAEVTAVVVAGTGADLWTKWPMP